MAMSLTKGSIRSRKNQEKIEINKKFIFAEKKLHLASRSQAGVHSFKWALTIYALQLFGKS